MFNRVLRRLTTAPAAPSIPERLKNDLKTSMRAGDKFRLGVIKSLISDLSYAEKAPGGMTDGPESVIQKALKRRRDSVDAFTQGGRTELADNERAEIKIIEEFLPKQLSEAELDGIVRGVAAKIGAASIKDLGKLIKEMPAHIAPGAAPKKAVAESVKRVLQGL